MPPEVLPPPSPAPGLPPEPSPEPRPARRAHVDKIVCEFCECELSPTPSGDAHYLTLSDKAKTYRKQADTIQKLEEKIAEHERTIADLRSKLTEANTARETKRGLFDSI